MSNRCVCAALVVLALLAAPRPAAADFVVDQEAFTNGSPVTFERFDPGLGTLLGVDIRVTATNPFIQANAANLSGVDQIASPGALSRLDLVLPGFDEILVYGSGGSFPTVLLHPDESATLVAYNFSASGLVSYSVASDLSWFTRDGIPGISPSYQIQAQDRSMATFFPSVSSWENDSFGGGWSGEVTVTYTYATPAPGGLTLALSGGLAAAAYLWCLRRRNAARGIRG